ncbi:MAG: DNA topoisomerase IB [Hyphomicrobiales bacterium]|nr:DNA topoisomerase IB [Hyphomicrobiales bacterium]
MSPAETAGRRSAATRSALTGMARRMVRRAKARNGLRRAGAKGRSLRVVTAARLTIRRVRQGRGWRYIDASGRTIRDAAVVRRLTRLAMPPAYDSVLYAEDPAAHLQAVGRDAAGRLQYRYHPDWEKVREQRKAHRLAKLAQSLPRIHKAIGRHLGEELPTRELALAAVIELVSASAIRAGRETYARQRGTRGAATLLKTNVSVEDERIGLRFCGKGGKIVTKSFKNRRLARSLAVLRTLPGPRLFQYRDADGAVRSVRARDANAFLRELAGQSISLKDFRTLIASASILEMLARTKPEASERQRRRQVLQAIRVTADDLHNTPAICRRSYVHDTVIAAFEEGALERFAETLAAARSPLRRAQVLARIVAPTALDANA